MREAIEVEADSGEAPLAASKVPAVRDMVLDDIGFALRAGLRDYRTKPMMGLFFSHVYVVGGWLLYVFFFVTDQIWWAIPITLGFPLLGPFLAVGLYEVSRRLEAGQKEWRRNDIFGVIWRQRLRQLPSIAWIIIVYFLFWSFFAHMLFALFLGPSALTNVTSSYAYLLEPEGLAMLMVGTGFGAVFAFALFCLTAVSLPLLLDKELDFVTAMLTSIAVVRRNPGVMLAWGFVIAGLTFLGMLPGLLGLFVVLPVLGHATWHIYRRALLSQD
ncbi:DUF2189 domain-containing protein [Roseicyclus mahoneyensis]|uniref:Putative membrane protein n=1 Tax=Roseicyclus mahoneyensis TaxID=164332 RepID=A0A316GRJ1_9RHOB|nr:DUF2189 domain-containing protein [Roseicyclus mahoneyensis]PWK62246.1 putative membrane protein [Roseicyclus mahoneyensis]